jgi:hypothetical protein
VALAPAHDDRHPRAKRIAAPFMAASVPDVPLPRAVTLRPRNAAHRHPPALASTRRRQGPT